MERLTYRDKDGFPMMKKRGGFKQGGVERLAAYEDTRLEPEEIDMDHEAAEQLRHLCRNCDLDRLEKLAEADRDGQLVVRCEGCKHRIYKYVNSWIGEIGGCNIFNHPMPNDAFCSYGERKDGGDG